MGNLLMLSEAGLLIARKLKMAKIEVQIESGKNGWELPVYKGSTFRGSFGHSFKKKVCTIPNETSCQSCLLQAHCPYPYIFETSPQNTLASTKNRGQMIPRPFLIEPPLDKRTLYEEGEKLSFFLTLFGKAIDYLPYFIIVLREMGREGIGKRKLPYGIRQILSLDQYGEVCGKVYSGATGLVNAKELRIITGADIIMNSEKNGTSTKSKEQGQICLNFCTPTRLQSDSKLICKPEMDIIMRSVLRRISSLLEFHQGIEMSMDFRSFFAGIHESIQLVENQTEWLDWERYSNRQEEKLKMGGIVGKAVYEGEGIDAILPWLKLAEWVHVGKNPLFGLGMVRVEYIEH